MKRVVVTGASGFIGQALCQHLVQQNWLVQAVYRTPPVSIAYHHQTCP